MRAFFEGLTAGFAKASKPTPSPAMSQASTMPAAQGANVCNECHGMFPTPEALGMHLMWHNQLRALQGGAAAMPPAPVAMTPPVHPTGSYTTGTVDHYDQAKGFGFIRRSAPGASSGQVYFHRDVVASGTVQPLKRGDAVEFIEQHNHKRGPRATSVRKVQLPGGTHGHATRPAAPVEEDATVNGIVVAYAADRGFGSIAKLDGSQSPNVYFTIHVCDIKRPPLMPGERVKFKETVGPKGPTAAVVRRSEAPALPAGAPTHAPPPPPKAKAKAKQNKAGSKPPPVAISNEMILTALTRAMHMVVNSPRDGEASPVAPRTSNAARGAGRSRAKSTELLTPKEYEAMIASLSSQPDGVQFVPVGIAMLARTKPVEASTIEATGDRMTQAMLLTCALEDELEQLRRRVLIEQAEGGDFASFLDFGYAPVPSPVGRQPEPEPEQPQTMYCGICMDDIPIEDIFFVSGCDHTYCRKCIHTYVIGRINQQDVMPKCPHDGCETVISDGDLTMVLTIEEQENYYKTCRDLAIVNEPGLFQCLQPNCPGIGALPQDDPHFVCPVCRAERCVQCNTRVWHSDLTCEQHRQREQDSQLHPEQVRQMYGNESLYQCGRCSYGPVLRKNCGDLISHHGELVNGVRIDNSCPRCKWLARNISEWQPWNGKLHAEPAVAAEVD